MAKIDSKLLDGFKTQFNVVPKNYVYAVTTQPFIIRMLLGLGVFGMMMERAYALGFDGDKVYFLKVSRFNAGRVQQGGHMTLTKADFTSVKMHKLGPATFAKVRTKDGVKMLLAVNKLVRYVEKQQEGIEAFKTYFESIQSKA